MMETGQKSNKRTIFAWLIILTCIGVAAYNYYRAKNVTKKKVQKEVQVPVAVARARFGTIDMTVKTIGDLYPARQVDIFAKIPGKVIEKIFVEKGDHVNAGQIVAVLEKKQIEAAMNRARAAVDAARTKLELLETDRRRIQVLYEKEAISKQKLDHIEAETKAARAALKQAKASLAEISVTYADHDVRSPISGVVSERFVDAGNLSGSKIPILRITDESSLKLRASFPEKVFGKIRPGLKVFFSVDAYPDKKFPATVSIKYPDIDPVTRSGRIEINVDNTQGLLAPGMFADTLIFMGTKKCLLVPAESLLRMPGTGSSYVFVAMGQVAREVNVEAGDSQGNMTEIRSGLKEGDMVIVKGQNRLRDNTRIRIAQTLDSSGSPMEEQQ